MENQKILIQIQTETTKISKLPTNQKLSRILSALGYDDHELSVVITDDPSIMALNQTHRGIAKPTNVLSFPMLEGEFSAITPGLLGDLVISIETAEREAVDAGISLEERMSQLMVHGILHLVGFDHEQGEKEAVQMEQKSLELLRLIETNPDLDAF
ncbi:MAG: rRNA maturation RNase YbeY [Desulfobacterium sp.]|nr:rRNA maturation RNase YbeY [Desulfobacterium sp.]